MAPGKRELIEVRCPCCEATLQIDPELKAVISHQEHKKPPAIEDIGAAVQKLKGEEARRSWRRTPLEQGVITTDLDVRLLFSTEEDIPDLLDRFAERHKRILEEIEEIAFAETPHVSYLARVINMQRASVERRLRGELEWLEDATRELEVERDRLGR